MLKYTILVLSLLGVSVVHADNDELRKKIEKSLQDVKVSSLKAIDDTGLYEAVINGQILYFQYLHGLNKIGIRFVRSIHNLDFYHYTGYYLTDHFNQYWASLATVLYSTWHFRNFSFNFMYGMQRDLNYQWDWVRYTDVGFKNVGNDKYNISLNMMLTYRL